jgi:DNA-directed RNA polymerase subunit RPC12/RpoP
MIKKRFKCRNCGKIFVIDVFEPGEAEAKKIPSGPVRCPDCGSTHLSRD